VNGQDNPLLRAVDELTEFVKTPRPPHDLAWEMKRRKSGKKAYSWTIAATLLAGLALIGVRSLRERPRPAGTPVFPQFVVERLRVRGAAVRPEVMEVAGAGALVLVMPPLRGDVGPKHATPPATALLGGPIVLAQP
jgi:hypothetical protein